MKTFRVLSMVVIVAMLAGAAGIGAIGATALASAKPAPIAIGAMPMNGVHMVPPSKSGLDFALAQQGLPFNATPEQRAAAEKVWYEKFQKQTDTWVNPGFQQYAIEREKQLAGKPNALGSLANQSADPTPVTATIYAMAVDFNGSDTFTNFPVEDSTGACVPTTITTTGPRVGEIPQPPADDNFTLWYSPAQTTDANFYKKIIFGHEGAGRVRTELTDPDDGLPGINLAGYTVQDYYDQVAGVGNVNITGTVEGWVTVDHSEGYYGANNCAAGSNGGGGSVPVVQLVVDAVDKFQDAHPTYWNDPDYWPTYDANHDGILDTFWLIHAGMGEEAGGGEEGTFAIWAHSSDLRYYMPAGYQVYEGDEATDDDDIYIGPYTMQPEMSETGVFAEEFGHNFFGLPDLYTQDANNSIGDWAIMSGGAWMGWLGGTVPASMPLWFKMIAAGEVNGEYVPLNWHLPMVTRDYKDPSADIEIGNLESTPAGVNKGVRVNLPDIVENIPNNAGVGPGAYSGSGRDATDITLSRDIAVPAGAAGVLSIDAYWEIEDGWDYAYVMVNGTIIPDTTGYFSNDDPNGNNLGWGLTGVGQDTLKFDLSSYAGSTVTLTVRYKTDAAATEAGLWIDNVTLDGAVIDDFAGATGSGTFPGWTNSDPGWFTVPTEAVYTNYYLVEWRTKTKYDRMVKSAYIFNDDNTVSRVPYNIPAALVYYRNTKYGSTYAQRGNYGDEPSYGSKYQLLIVDQNWKPVRMIDGATSAYKGYLTGRIGSYDAGLTLQDAEAFTIPSVNGITGSNFSIPAKPAVTQFNDALGYYAGFYTGAPCGGVCYVERDGSVVIPARGTYSTRITNFAYEPYYPYFGIPLLDGLGLPSSSWLGTGNPGEANVQHGVNVKLLSKTGNDADNSLATLRFYNYSVDIKGKLVSYRVSLTGVHAKFEVTIQNVGTETAKNVVLQWASDDKQGVQTQNIATIAPGAQVKTTLDIFIKTALTSGKDFALTYELMANDGQVARGPFWYDVTGPVNFFFMPRVSK